MSSIVKSIVDKYGKDGTRLMDIFIDLTNEVGCVDNESISEIAKLLSISKVDVEQSLSFYHFFSKKSRGKYTIYLNDSLVARMMGRMEIAEAFEKYRTGK